MTSENPFHIVIPERAARPESAIGLASGTSERAKKWPA
jgi:hypothetical protein